MDQQTLRQWESRCIQEEPPFCQAACPLRADGRAFVGLIARGDLDGARKILERTLPLPGVLGRVCEAPCEGACKRKEAGGAISIGALERHAVTRGKPGPRPVRLPGRGRHALILGSGLAALTCAWDLLKKGHGVTLRTLGQPLFGRLNDFSEAQLPREALEAELATLKALGLHLDEGPGVAKNLLETALAQGQAVFLEHGLSPHTDAGYPARAGVDAVTLAAPNGPEGLFLGGWAGATGGATEGAKGRQTTLRCIDAAADGRRAASSMDRWLTGASLTAARDKEGPCPTRLFTSMAGVHPLPRVEPDWAGYNEEGARAEAERCLNCQCLECVRVCDYLEKHKGHPKTYARQIYNNAAIVKGQHLANKLVNSCSLCGLCGRVCPEGFDMAELCLAARRDMVARGAMPQSAHEFALEDMAAADGPDFALCLPDPAAPPGEQTCAYVFFPGCQLSASHPHHVESAYAYLRRHLSAAGQGGGQGGVGLMLGCCGIPAHWAGQTEAFRRSAENLARQWESLGRPKVVAACSGCLSVFRLPEFQQAAPGLCAVSLWEVLDTLPLPGNGILPRPFLALHDPCTARDDEAFRRAVRSMLSRLGVPWKELEYSGEKAECCGFGGLMALVDPPLGHTVARRRAAESRRDYLASCAMCRDRLYTAGKRTWHLLDLVFPCADCDPAGLPGPGWSERQEARAALKSRLLRNVWGRDDGPRPAPLELLMTPEVRALLEERRILAADLRQTIIEAVTAGRILRDGDADRLLASHRPRRVTFWAEFRPEGEGYRVLNAWSHRMTVPGAGGVEQAQGDQGAGVNRTDQTYLPASGSWTCVSCGQELAPAPVVVSYLGSVFTISLLACKECGQTLVPEELALGRMAEVEQLLEDK